MLESADAEANRVGLTGDILRSITSYETEYKNGEGILRVAAVELTSPCPIKV